MRKLTSLVLIGLLTTGSFTLLGCNGDGDPGSGTGTGSVGTGTDPGGTGGMGTGTDRTGDRNVRD